MQGDVATVSILARREHQAQPELVGVTITRQFVSILTRREHRAQHNKVR